MPVNFAESIPRLKRLIPRMRGKRIGVLGDLMLDRYLWGNASRLSPEAAVPVVDAPRELQKITHPPYVVEAPDTFE